jgi:hypothetical protein
MELTLVILDCRSVGDGQDVLETLEGVLCLVGNTPARRVTQSVTPSIGR